MGLAVMIESTYHVCMSEALGYLLTWTCYGTWMHGDERGSVDADHNAPDAAFLPPNETRLMHEVRTMSHRPIRLDSAARRIVADTIAAHCDIRGWNLHAVNPRTNHVHAVVSCEVHPNDAMSQFKAWITRGLRSAGCFERDRPVWTEGGSRRWLWNPDALRRAIEYVNDYQGD